MAPASPYHATQNAFTLGEYREAVVPLNPAQGRKRPSGPITSPACGGTPGSSHFPGGSSFDRAFYRLASHVSENFVRGVHRRFNRQRVMRLVRSRPQNRPPPALPDAAFAAAQLNQYAWYSPRGYSVKVMAAAASRRPSARSRETL